MRHSFPFAAARACSKDLTVFGPPPMEVRSPRSEVRNQRGALVFEFMKDFPTSDFEPHASVQCGLDSAPLMLSPGAPHSFAGFVSRLSLLILEPQRAGSYRLCENRA